MVLSLGFGSGGCHTSGKGWLENNMRVDFKVKAKTRRDNACDASNEESQH
jgi:hypothetical protein